MMLILPRLIVPQLPAHGLAKLRIVKELAAKNQDVKILSVYQALIQKKYVGANLRVMAVTKYAQRNIWM